MRGGRNKFGPMYKRDRARRMQIMRQRQQQIVLTNNSSLNSNASSANNSISISTTNNSSASAAIAAVCAGNLGSLTHGQTSTGSEPFSLLNQSILQYSADGIKQELIQIPHLSSSTSSPDSSPSPLSGLNSAAGTGTDELETTAPKDKEWQSNLFNLLNEHTYNQCEVDLFDLTCKVIEKNLFAQVDWARNSIFFKELEVDDQMKLLQHSWSHLLVLDHIHQRIHHGLQDETSLPNGQKFSLISLALLGEPSSAPDMMRVQRTLTELKFDHFDYLCVKFLLLLNPEVRGLLNHRIVQEAQDQTQNALLQYTVNFYPQVTDKFNKLMSELPRLRQLTVRGEEYLHFKHINAPTNTLLMEMLNARRK